MLAKSSAKVSDLVEIQEKLTEVQSELDSEAAERKILANGTEKIAAEINFRIEESQGDVEISSSGNMRWDWRRFSLSHRMGEGRGEGFFRKLLVANSIDLNLNRLSTFTFFNPFYLHRLRLLCRRLFKIGKQPAQEPVSVKNVC